MSAGSSLKIRFIMSVYEWVFCFPLPAPRPLFCSAMSRTPDGIVAVDTVNVTPAAQSWLCADSNDTLLHTMSPCEHRVPSVGSGVEMLTSNFTRCVGKMYLPSLYATDHANAPWAANINASALRKFRVRKIVSSGPPVVPKQ
jgi:hypothetical protein